MRSVGLAAGALGACGAPISNAPFTEEATFFAALPTADTFGAPREVLLAANGTSEVLAAGKAAAARWDALAEAPLVLSVALLDREPTDRTEAARRWAVEEVAATYTGAVWGADVPRTLWVSAEVLALEDGSHRATISGAAAREEAPVPLASATRDGEVASMAWDLPALARLWGVEDGALAELDAEAELHEGARAVTASHGAGPAAEAWTFADDDTVGFQAPLAVTDDGATWPAAVEVHHRRDEGGRGDGVVYRGAEELGFSRCWDADGLERPCG